MKNNETTKLIDKILHESSLDPRIETGIFDIHNYEHMQVMAEHMEAVGVDKKIIAEVINELVMDEGKYPERQAYNKDGWLVTFPSAEYKRRAIKKGTHYGSDPTHGKGGMHLYYKGKGKQKRQVQQDPSQTTPKQPVAQTAKAIKPTTPAPEPADDDEEEDDDPYGIKATRDAHASARALWGADWDAPKKPAKKVDVAPEEPAAEPEQSPEVPAERPAPTQQAPEVSPVAAVPAAPIAPDFTKPSKKFAETKAWKVTPYGEWRDKLGNTVAVTGLSGEVVPLKNTDREEFKIFAEKNPM